MNSQVPVPATGLTVIVDNDTASVDIVFVHGFTGHPERTWVCQKGNVAHDSDDYDAATSSRPSKFQRVRNKFSNSVHSAVYWPRDLLPETIPDVRVLTYGYDTHIKHWIVAPVNCNTVRDIAWDFLVALEARRRQKPSRPLLFVVHSLGGIIVKEMICRSGRCRQGQEHLRNICDLTRGIVFLGTPHGGADPRGILHHVAQMAIKAVGFKYNEQIVNNLLPSAERLRELRDDFNPMAVERQWAIHSFQESLPVQGLGGKVVEDSSSYLGLSTMEITEHINSNHMEMCRFSGLSDPEYQKVAAALQRMTTNLHPAFSSPISSSFTPEQRQELLYSLKFDQIDARHKTIKAAHTKTCKWLEKKDEYQDWLNPDKVSDHHGFLWIKGNPGTGKSTLMKFALGQARKRRRGNSVVLEFFFNARGHDLEKSTAGLYRSLLFQLLCEIPELQCVFDSLPVISRPQDGSYQWSIEGLKDLFRDAINMLGERRVICFIDALDECDDDQAIDMVSFFEAIGETIANSGIRFLVCFSSRHYPHIDISHKVQFVLEGQEGHSEDIRNYVNSKLSIGHSKLAEEIREELFNKAAGIFMWVVLVVEILNKEKARGRISALRQRLREIPAGLSELLRDILTRDSRDQQDLIMCVQWVLFAKHPLKPEELYFAIHASTDTTPIEPWEPDFITMDVIQAFILDCSKGLAETTKAKIPVVQFIHESVRDFLLKENGLQSIWPDLGNCLEGTSHDRLAACCLRYVSNNITRALCVDGELPTAKDEIETLRNSASTKYPFLPYAVHNLLHHANQAQSFNVSQTNFVRAFQVREWVVLANLFEKFKIRHHRTNASLFYISAEHNLSHLIESQFSALSPLTKEGQRYGSPFLAALATGSTDAVQAMARAVIRNSADPQDPFHTLCQHYAKNRDQIPTLSRNFNGQTRPLSVEVAKRLGHDPLVDWFSSLDMLDGFDFENRDISGKSRLLRAASFGYIEAIQALLATGKVDPDSRDDYGRTPLSWAASFGYIEAIQALLATGKVDPDSRDNDGWTPLLRAASFGRIEAIQALLATGKVDPDSRDNDGRTPLLRAASSGRIEAIQALLATGKVDPDPHDDNGRTPLSWAASFGNIEAIQAIQALLATGKVDPDSRDNDGLTPLAHAARGSNPEAVSILLKAHGVDVNSKNNDGKTPLDLAKGSLGFQRQLRVEVLVAAGAKSGNDFMIGLASLFMALRASLAEEGGFGVR